jgi:hypothetical protein
MIEGFGTLVVRRETRERSVLVIAKADAHIGVSLNLLASPIDSGMTLDSGGDVLTFEAENGTLKYAITDFDPIRRALVCELIFSTVDGIEI